MLTPDIGGRPAAKQLGTARLLLAQFDAQIAEYECMNREQRRTPRGRDLATRIDGLRKGHATWTLRAAELEAAIPKPMCPECAAGKHTICSDLAIDPDDNIVACTCTHEETP